MKKAYRRGSPRGKRVRVKAVDSETVACRMPIPLADKLRELARREERTMSYLLNRFVRQALDSPEKPQKETAA